MAYSDPPSRKQLNYLRALAEETGTSFSMPQTRRDAMQEIDRLKARSRSSPCERREDLRAVSQELAEQQPSSSVKDDEILGHGSNCRWANGESEGR